MGQPDTIGVTQLLDQIFAMLHAAYSSARDDMFFDKQMNRESFMNVLAESWNEWASPERIGNTARKVGISANYGFNVNDRPICFC